MVDDKNTAGSEQPPSMIPEKIVQVFAPGETAESKPEVGKAPMVMPGQPNAIAEEISHVGPEGRPADPKTGPKLLRLEIFGLFAIVLVFAGVMGAMMGWPAGLLSLAIGSFAFFFSPLFGATMARASDRQKVADAHVVHDRVAVQQAVEASKGTFRMR